MERDPEIGIERNPARRGPAAERSTITAIGPVVAPMAAHRDDRVHWGPIWAGFVISLMTSIILGSLAAAIGLAGATSATAGTPAATGGGVAAAIILLLALFAGGYTSGTLLERWGAPWGAAHGVLVAGLVLIAALLGTAAGSLGLGNAAANLFGALNMGATFNPRAYGNIPPAEITAAAARAAGWFTVVSLLGVGAAALGGYLATRRETGRTGRHHDVAA